MLNQARKSGFTLLELLIVVIIVSILAAVALPRFGRMTRRSRAAEAFTSIGALLTAESLYYQERGIFTGTIGELLVEVDPTNFGYALTATGGTSARVVATGTAAPNPAAGIIVTGTVLDTGARTIVSN